MMKSSRAASEAGLDLDNACAPAPHEATTVGDETLIYWLQRACEPLLSDADVATSAAAILATVAPFERLAARDTAYLAASPRLVAARDAVRQCKGEIHPMPDEAYGTIRNRLFPLARSGPMSANVGNRAAFKLLESMEACGITLRLFGDTSTVAPPDAPSHHHHHQHQQLTCINNNKAKAAGGAVSGSAATASAAARAGKRKGARAREVVFVDVCGGPGSFAQALLHAVRRAPKTRVRGYGMTLAHPTLSWYSELLGCADFTPTFGVDGTGSVYDPANVEALVSICRADRVGFVMGDGGFDVPHEQLTMQEAITARIVYSQWFIALRLLADGGSLVLKLFETSSVFLRSMLVLSCLFFSNVAIAKPAHSRVVNSERYLSCSGFRAGVFTARWLRTLADVHATAFGDGVAPFTLLPDVDLAATCSGPAGSSSSSALRRILRRIELSITATATRQAAALSMILREFRDKQLRDEAAAPAVP